MEDSSTKTILESLRRIESGLGDVREQLAGLKSWRDTAWPAMQSMQDSHERRLDRIEQDRAMKAEVAALEVRVRQTEEFKYGAKTVITIIGFVAGAVASVLIKAFMGM